MKIRPKIKKDSKAVKNFMIETWGGEMLFVRGKKYYPENMDGFIAEEDGKIVGYLIYEDQGDQYEIIVFESLEKFKGVGTRLLDTLKALIKAKGLNKIVVMTTNDDLDALRFYQRRGFVICGIGVNAIEGSRKVKPSIPMNGDYNIPIRDEIYLEMEVE